MPQDETCYTRNCEIRNGREMPQGMQRIALGVEYNGASFHGFQKQQSGVATVQETLELALSKVADETITLVCAGRTDASVHATNQIIHFDTLAQRKDLAWVFGVNTHLPDGVVVKWAQPVSEHFHARFSAKSRTYRYVICNSFVRPALMSDQLTWLKHPLDVEAMRQGAAYLLGEHDFTSFRASQCQAKSPIRILERLGIFQLDELIVLEVRANAFLHHMVRNIVGVLSEVGQGIKPPQWVDEVLQAKSRCQGGVTAPPYGLYLASIDYDSQFELPQSPIGPRFLPEQLGDS